MIGRILLWETSSLFSSKKFLLAFVFQFVLIATFVPLLDTYMESLESNEFVSLTPGTRNFVPVASSGSSLLPQVASEKTFRVYDVEEAEARRLIEKRIVSTRLSKDAIILDSANPKSEVAKFYVTRILQKITLGMIDIRFSIFQAPITDPQEVQRQEARTEIRKTTELVRRNRINTTTMLLLLLPLFVSSGLLLDSLMGEKEKRTHEILLALPTRPASILAGKMLSVLAIVFVQICAFLVLLFFLDRISTFAVALPLMLTSLLLVSVTSFIAVFSKSYKEAGFTITVLYVLLFSFMFGATTVHAFAREVSYLSPLTLVVMLESGRLALRDVFWASVPTLLSSGVLISLAVAMYGKDEFQFGPRPPIASLLSSLVSGMGRFPFSSSLLGGILAIPLSLLLELSCGIILTYILGTTKGAIVVVILVFALIEEYFKSLGIFSARALGGRSPILYGALSGAAFALAENLFFLFAIQSVFPSFLVPLILKRLAYATMLHIVCSSIVGAGIARNNYYLALGAAALVHAAYNIAQVMP